MSEAENDTRERIVVWECSTCGEVKRLRDGDQRPSCGGAGERMHAADPKPMLGRPLIPESALTAALEERDALREKWAAYGAGGARRENELEADLERAEADLAAEGDPLCVCQDTGARAIKGACPEHHGDACLINLPGYCIRATEDREARFRAEAALAEALDVIEAVVAGIVTLDGARVVLRKHGRLP